MDSENNYNVIENNRFQHSNTGIQHIHYNFCAVIRLHRLHNHRSAHLAPWSYLYQELLFVSNYWYYSSPVDSFLGFVNLISITAFPCISCEHILILTLLWFKLISQELILNFKLEISIKSNSIPYFTINFYKRSWFIQIHSLRFSGYTERQNAEKRGVSSWRLLLN